MMRLLALALLCTLFAGCADEAPEPVTDETFEDFETPTTIDDDKGILRGVVVDQAIVPIANAKVVLSGGDETRTNENGAFQFVDLEPGTHFMEVSALGYKSAQSSADVVAGEAAPSPVKIQLVVDPAGVPYYGALQVKGYIMCGTDVVALCGGIRDFTGQTDDTYSFIYETGANITHLQTEMVWQSTQALGDSFTVTHRYATQENYDGGFYDGGLDARGTGPSPLLVVTNADNYNEAGVGDPATGYKFMTSIFAGAAEGNPVGIGGVALDQPYEMFIHEFHGYAPPEGWRFTDGEGVPGPAA